ncbi:unnamed protein product, partial [Rotaria sordida]
MWRYLPVGDLLVDVMISRDLDSPLTQRERAAVDEWLSMKVIFHAMRDHPRHNTPLRTFNHPTLLCKYDQEANTEFVPPEMRS